MLSQHLRNERPPSAGITVRSYRCLASLRRTQKGLLTSSFLKHARTWPREPVPSRLALRLVWQLPDGEMNLTWRACANRASSTSYRLRNVKNALRYGPRFLPSSRVTTSDGDDGSLLPGRSREQLVVFQAVTTASTS